MELKKLSRINLKRKSLDELAKTMEVVSAEEQKLYLGGGYSWERYGIVDGQYTNIATWYITNTLQEILNYLNSNAHSSSTGYCARAVREALEAGGIVIDRCSYAYQYGDSLLGAGFVVVDNGIYQPGDIIVYDNDGTHQAGHMQMYNGDSWVSDFNQASICPWNSNVSSYSYKVYRYNNYY